MPINNKKEVMYHVINSILAGALVFLGSCVNSEITLKTFYTAFIASLIVAVSKFQQFWTKDKKKICKKASLFSFVG